MIKSYVGTAEGKTLAVYEKKAIQGKQIMRKKLSNGFYVAEIDDGKFNVVHFSAIEAEIDHFIEEKREGGFRYVQM